VGCGPRYLREPVYREGLTEVYLRGPQSESAEAPGRFEHPATISRVRLAHILSLLDVENGDEGKEKRSPAIASEQLYEIADGLSAALARAKPTQEIIVRSRHRERRFGLFFQDRFTSFVAYVWDGTLQLFFSYVDWAVPKAQEEELPEPQADRPAMKFRFLASVGITPIGGHGIAVNWRDARFGDPKAVRISPTGELRRRTILLEKSESSEDTAPAESTAPLHLSPETLRRLADLEEARRRGELTEAAYQAERLRIIAADPSAVQ